jgi:thioredoxin reductase
MSSDSQLLDLIIIGAAAAGCSAAVYAARRNLNFIIITKDIGGEVALSGDVDNWPGIIHTTGIQLAQDFHKHALSYQTNIQEGWEISAVHPEKNNIKLLAKNDAGEEKIFLTKSLIVATGIHPKQIGIPGEVELKGRGVTTCTVCDGPLYRKKVTATIGAGNSALESALMMSDLAEKVYLLTKYPNDEKVKGGFPKGEDILIKKVKEKTNVEIIYNTQTEKILGEQKVTSLVYRDTVTHEEKDIAVDGVMVHVGMTPNSHFATCLEKNLAGEIKINLLCQTSVPGIFAAGDVTDIPFKQISIAAGHGATAALSAIDYLNHWEEVA